MHAANEVCVCRKCTLTTTTTPLFSFPRSKGKGGLRVAIFYNVLSPSSWLHHLTLASLSSLNKLGAGFSDVLSPFELIYWSFMNEPSFFHRFLGPAFCRLLIPPLPLHILRELRGAKTHLLSHAGPANISNCACVVLC